MDGGDTVALAEVLPNPNRCEFDCGSVITFVLGEGDRIFGLGNPEGCELPGCGIVCPLLASIFRGYVGGSNLTASCLSSVGCQYVPVRFSIVALPGRGVGSNALL